MCAFELRSALHRRWPIRFEQSEVIRIAVPSTPPTQEHRSAAERAELRLTAPAALNIPAGFIGLGRTNLVPGGVQRELWLSVTWPLAGLIFWWIAGRAIDALRAFGFMALNSGSPIIPRVSEVRGAAATT